MLAVSLPSRVFLAKAPTDMRKSFNGLISLTESVLEKDPVSGHLFVFINRRRDLIKVLYWDGSGFCIWYKRLESGGFQLPPADANAKSIELTTAQLSLILDGIDLMSVKQRRRFQLPANDAGKDPAQ